MPSEALLLGIATIAVVVAGFTAVTSTLAPPGGSWHPAMRIRQRAIVSTSFNVMFESLAPLIAFAWLGDGRAAIVVASAGVAVYATGIVIWRGRQMLRAGGTRTRTALVLYALGPTATLLFLGERGRVRFAGRLRPRPVHPALGRVRELLFARLGGRGLTRAFRSLWWSPGD